MGAHILGALLAFVSALVYGSADFFGGIATRRFAPYAVLSSAALVGIIPLIGFAIIFGESWPDPNQLLWASTAGFAGMFGLVFLYHGIAHGNLVIISPVSGVVSALIPVSFAMLFFDLPTLVHLIGFTVALPGIWLVTQEQSRKNAARPWEKDLALGTLSGTCFGLFFICLAQLNQTTIFGPLAISKAVSFFISVLFTVKMRLVPPSPLRNPAILLAGVLDPTANALYVAATRFTRVDVAAVLSSLYPAGTIVLALVILKTPIQRQQWLGIGLCLVATVLIMS
jgi:drug/metabolite transporter (DMT)-like permease